MKLLVVESYNKIKSIKKFLGSDYEVIASGGHIRELKSNGYGFEKDTLMPVWEVVKKSKNQNKEEKTIQQVQRYAAQADQIFLATDPDREGESISWHLFDILDKDNQKKCKRITFNEITKKAVTKALENPRDIDMNLVESQWARRILDRLVGYGLSSLVKSKLHARSAGRVQSVALLFIVERFLEIQNFVPRFWWTIDAKLNSKNKKMDFFPVQLRETSTKYEMFEKDSTEYKFAKLADAEACFKLLSNEYKLYKIDEPSVSLGRVMSPFATDTLLTTAYNQLGWSTSKTNKLAQELYNGVSLNNEVVSLISYPRTDTNRLNSDFMQDTREYITKYYGPQYVAHTIKEPTKGDFVQDAHEGIRPIDISVSPKSLEGKIQDKNANDIIKLYTLIWTQTICSFMLPPKFNVHVLRFANNEQKFYTSYKKLIFEGYNAIPHVKKDSSIDNPIDLTHLKEGDVLTAYEAAKINEHQTEPPGLYNEGSLVRELKKSGIGRPSTYSTMVNIVKDRGYVDNAKKLSPTELGILLIQNLIKEFSSFVSKEFTAKMEKELDNIAEGKQDWNSWIKNFKKLFDENMLLARQNMPKVEPTYVGRKCPLCDNELVVQTNRRNKTQFIGCSNYKGGCKYTERIVDPNKKPSVILEELCPLCTKPLIQRYNKRGEQFVGCTGFPSCKYIANNKKPS